MLWPRCVGLTDFFSPMSLIWCSLGAGGRNCIVKGVLPFSGVTSKGDRLKSTQWVVVGVLSWRGNSCSRSSLQRRKGMPSGLQTQLNHLRHASLPGRVARWESNPEPLDLEHRSRAASRYRLLSGSLQVPSGGRAAWGRPTNLHIYVGYTLPPQFLPLLLNGDGEKKIHPCPLERA